MYSLIESYLTIYILGWLSYITVPDTVLGKVDEKLNNASILNSTLFEYVC